VHAKHEQHSLHIFRNGQAEIEGNIKAIISAGGAKKAYMPFVTFSYLSIFINLRLINTVFPLANPL